LQTQALVLYTAAGCRPAPDSPALTAQLAALGLIGEAIQVDDEARFLVGDRFFQALSFLGCSPYIEITPGEDGRPFCHVSVEVFDQATLLDPGGQRNVVGEAAITLWHIHQGEAVPTDPLLEQLQSGTGCRWRYCYVTR
jgi:hypothetical protein